MLEKNSYLKALLVNDFKRKCVKTKKVLLLRCPPINENKPNININRFNLYIHFS